MPRKLMGSGETVACDGRCDKAWGINGRRKYKLSKDVDDYVFLGDAALGTAPGPGKTRILSDGFDCKPSATPLPEDAGHRMTKWCVRECERSERFNPGEPIVLRDMCTPKPNIPRDAKEKR